MTTSGPSTTGLYRPEFERDSCGFSLIAQLNDQASHWLVDTAIKSLASLTHHGAMVADGEIGAWLTSVEHAGSPCEQGSLIDKLRWAA